MSQGETRSRKSRIGGSSRQPGLNGTLTTLRFHMKGGDVGSQVSSAPAPESKPARAPEPDEEVSAFGKQIQWDTPVNDHYGDQYFAMCLAVKVDARHDPSSARR